MRFTATSTEFLQALLSVSKAIPQKSNIPVLENFLLELEGSNLTITASDQETTLKTIMAIENVKEGGRIAIPALLLTNSFKELPTQPVEFATNEENNLIKITWASGSAKIPCLIPEDYPELPALVDPKTIEIPANVLTDAINGTIYATAEETLRPVMNGIFFDINPDSTTFVASNAHKLVCFTRKDIKGAKSSFVLPKKPANILKNNLARLSDESVNINEFAAGLTGDMYREFIDSYAASADVYTRLPEFGYDYSVVLNDILRAMGVEDAFTDNANFGNITEEEMLYISKVLHNTHIEVDRNGTRAAAATAVMLDTMGISIADNEAVTIYLDRPFVYAIVDASTDIPVFIGTVNEI